MGKDEEIVNIYWISWWEKSEDYRPLTYPPNEAIIGWWNSGERCSDDAVSICAAVRAKNEKAAWAAIDKDWPLEKGDSREIRFCELNNDFNFSDRFSSNEWMAKRLEVNQNEKTNQTKEA